MIWAGTMACMRRGEIGADCWWGKLLGKETTWKTKNRREFNITMHFKRNRL